MSASTARASHNSNGFPSGENARFFSAKEIAGLLSRLDIPRHLHRTFPLFWHACTQPFGREIQLFKPLKDFAHAAQICERTARLHLRAFERLDLIEVAVLSDGKRLVANTIRRPTTYRLRTETLERNRWPECKRCGHKHENSHECGCKMDTRRGRFRTKDGATVSKFVHRTCRCKPLLAEPTPTRLKRSNPAAVPSSAAAVPSAAQSTAAETPPSPRAQRGLAHPQLTGINFRLAAAARMLMDLCGVPYLENNQAYVEQAILSESKRLGLEISDAAKQISECVQRDQQAGVTINRYYFRDGKWRSNGTNQQRLTAAQSRSERSKESLVRAITGLHERDREVADGPDSPDPPEREE